MDVSDLDSEGDEEVKSSDSPEPSISVKPELSTSDMAGTSGVNATMDIKTATEQKLTDSQSAIVEDLENRLPKSNFDGNDIEDKLSEPKSVTSETETEKSKEGNVRVIGVSVEEGETTKCETAIGKPISGDVGEVTQVSYSHCSYILVGLPV